ncbi:MAG: SDR family oxidoreductase [Bacteroides sp.]|nr:SDR family oxidoreductase [Roseburia sp.]MCM1347463.1 SDR family oxidoreductase [Bacteroides sp.]MCM1421932.1 SDR family oxidoreductase [Bacteroides sp.]
MKKITRKPYSILVAGGAGFIGSHLCERLLKEGYYVICLDNLYTGREQNIEHLLDNPKFKFVNHNIIHRFRKTRLTAIFNLACPASPVHYQRDAVYTTQTAVIGTMNLLELAQRNQCVLVQASTSEVYGNPEEHPQTESYWGHVNPNGFRSCYDEGKRCAESLCMDYHRQYGTEVKIVRIFNTYGPRMSPHDGRVVSNFIVQALEGKEVTIYGDGKQTRSFMYVSDLIKGLVRIMDTPEDFTGPVNIGNPKETAIEDLAQTIMRLTGSDSKVMYSMLPSDDPEKRKPDIQLARKMLGWKPTTPLERGIKRTIRHFMKEKKNPAFLNSLFQKKG